MASDRQQFRDALANWEALHDARAYSAPPDVGRVAIVCSYATELSESCLEDEREAEVEAFRREAHALADRIREREHLDVGVATNAGPQDIVDILQTPEFSHVITIGHGTFSSLSMNDPENGIVDWVQVAEAADHLKTGLFVQRQCGIFGRDLCVPLGAFAVSDHRNIIAVLGACFKPRNLDDPENDLLMPITTRPKLSYKYIKTHFPRLRK